MADDTQARLERIMKVYDIPEELGIQDLPEEQLTRVLDLIGLITMTQTKRLLATKYKYK